MHDLRKRWLSLSTEERENDLQKSKQSIGAGGAMRLWLCVARMNLRHTTNVDLFFWLQGGRRGQSETWNADMIDTFFILSFSSGLGRHAGSWGAGRHVFFFFRFRGESQKERGKKVKEARKLKLGRWETLHDFLLLVRYTCCTYPQEGAVLKKMGIKRRNVQRRGFCPSICVCMCMCVYVCIKSRLALSRRLLHLETI